MRTDGHRILVTGATGQVGRPIADALSVGNEVFAAARFRNEVARAELEAAGIATVVFDLGSNELGHLPDVDYVVHCAADTFPSTAARGMAINADGAGFLMSRYRDARGFLHMSSASVYHRKDDALAVYAEDDQLGGESPYSPHYAVSKLAAEAVVRFQSRSLGLPAIMTRLNVAYGSHGHGGLPMVLLDMMRQGAPYLSSPEWPSHCSLIHEDDIAAQVRGLLTHVEVGAPAVNLGGDEPVALDDIIGHLEDLSGLVMDREHVDDPVWHTQILDASLRRQLAGPCAVTWRDGIAAAIEARGHASQT